jgi:hypothetical protein
VITKEQTILLAVRYRKAYREGSLTNPRIIAKLESIPGWRWHPQAKHRSAEEWVPVAEKLAKKMGGFLPRAAWLMSNGVSGLHSAMVKRPDLFAHIPQEVWNNRGKLGGFRNGTAAQRRTLEIKHGLRKPTRKAA